MPPQKAIGIFQEHRNSLASDEACISCHESSDAHGDDTHVCYLCLMCIAQTKAGERWSTCPSCQAKQDEKDMIAG